MNAVATNPRDRSGNANGGSNVSALVQNRGGHAAGARVRFLVVDCIALLQYAAEFLPEPRKVRNGPRGGAFKREHRQ